MIIACTCVDENIYLSLMEWERAKCVKMHINAMPASILGIFILVLVHKITKCRILKERATALLGF